MLANLRHTRHGFTYIELLALLGISAILLSIFVPFMASQREGARRDICADHLRQLRDSLLEYARANRNDYPRALYDPAVNRNGYTAFTGPYVGTPFSPGVGPNDVTASLWLLVPDYVRDTGVFICPSTRNQPDRWIALQGGQRQPNFRSPGNLSYSYASPFSGNAQYRLNSDILPSEFALMADKNPGAAAASVAHDAPPLELARANSLNHGQAGQNVLFADGSVDFMRTPYCGVGRSATSPDGDNIYTVLTAEPLTEKMASPIYWGRGYVGRQYGAAYEYDSYLVPTEEDGW